MITSSFLYTATMSPDIFHELQVSASTQQIESCIRYLPSNFSRQCRRQIHYKESLYQIKKVATEEKEKGQRK